MHSARRFLLRWVLAGPVVFGLLVLAGARPARAAGKAFSVHTLHGRYSAAGNSSDASITDGDSDDDAPARAFVAAGFLNLDGKGKIASGEETINYGVPGSGDSFTCELAGTYTVDSLAGRAILTVNVTPGPALTPGESGPTNTAQCSGTATWVAYISGPDGKRLAVIEQTVVPGTPPAGIAADTPILSAHVWTKGGGSGEGGNSQGGDGDSQ